SSSLYLTSLRNVLEQYLAEDATPGNLALYLPPVRRIITDLLTGLRGKQSVYLRMQSHKSGSGYEGTDSRSPRGERTSSKRGELAEHHSPFSRMISKAEKFERERESTSQRIGPSSSGRRAELHSPPAVPGEDDRFVGGSAPVIVEHPQPLQYLRRRTPHPAPIPPAKPAPKAPTSSGAVPANVKCTHSSIIVIVEPSSPGQDIDGGSTSPAPETPPEFAPTMANSLTVPKKNNVLERRASKR
ncbi:hypothetical protein DXG01_010910, partial [Tephrocybe rancida]